MPILHFLIALLCAALSGTGVGGGGLFVIFLTLAMEVPQLQAQGLNLAFFIIGALFSMILHFRRRKIAVPIVLFVGLCGALGGVCGFYLAKILPHQWLSKLFGGMLLLCGLRTLFPKVKK